MNRKMKSDNNIPLSPQWLHAKPNESKDTRQVTYSDSIHKDPWQLDVPDVESKQSWREEERETGLLGRRESAERKEIAKVNIRRMIIILTVVQPGIMLILGLCLRLIGGMKLVVAILHMKVVMMVNGHLDGDLKTKTRTFVTARKMDAEKDDRHAKKQLFAGNNPSLLLLDSDFRDKWRPRHRQEVHSGGSSVYRATAGFGLEKGRAEGSNVGFASGRGRGNLIGGVSFTGASSAGPIGTSPINMNGTLHGKFGLTSDAYHYSRGKLLDIYKK